MTTVIIPCLTLPELPKTATFLHAIPETGTVYVFTGQTPIGGKPWMIIAKSHEQEHHQTPSTN